jgi:hypothetical protein
MSSTIRNFKRGGTFSYGCLVQLPAGTWDAEAQLRKTDGTLIDDLDVTLDPPVSPETRHTLLIERAASATASWPLEKLQGDVRFVDASPEPVKLPTSTYVVEVIRGITE